MPTSSTSAIDFTPQQEEAWFGLIHAHADVTRRIEALVMERHRLPFSSMEILCRLQGQEPQPVRVLAAQLVSVSPSRASRVVQDLVDEGLLERGADQSDGRISLVSLTPAGEKLADQAMASLQEAVQEYFFDPLDDRDIAAIRRIWTKLGAAQRLRP